MVKSRVAKISRILTKWLFLLILGSLASNIFWERIMSWLGLAFPPTLDAVLRIAILFSFIEVLVWSQGGTKFVLRILRNIRKWFTAKTEQKEITSRQILNWKVRISAIFILICATQYNPFIEDAIARREANISPYQQQIKTINADIEVILSSNDSFNTIFTAPAGFILTKNGNRLIQVSAVQYTGAQKGGGRKAFRAICDLNSDFEIGNITVISLKEADFGKIAFLPQGNGFDPFSDAGSYVLGGEVKLTINGVIFIDIPVPPQQIQQRNYVWIPDIRKSLSNLK